jgi:hypothetical protein
MIDDGAEFDEMTRLLWQITDLCDGYSCKQASVALLSALIEVEKVARECNDLIAIQALQLRLIEMAHRVTV